MAQKGKITLENKGFVGVCLHDIDMPIVQGIHGVLFEGTDPLQGVNTLMTRSAKSETHSKISSMSSREP